MALAGQVADPARRRAGRSVILGRLLVLAGLVLIAAFVGQLALAMWQESRLTDTFRRQVEALPGGAGSGNHQVQPVPVDGVDFAVRVPRLDYTAAVREGVGTDVLAAGPGHYPDTAWPGQQGNVGVAAHNTYWIAFGDLRPGDEVDLLTRWGSYTYRVTGSRVVNPDDRTVLVQAGAPRLTLTTCWPLWAGAFATQRLIIFAEQVSPDPARDQVP